MGPQAARSALTHIREACSAGAEGGTPSSSKTEVIVITFIHGWMHNATPEDANLEHFTDLIRRRAAAEHDFAKETGRKPRSIIGVYFAWRGLLWKLPVVSYLTFWSRKTAALRVGQLSCTEAVLRIIAAVKSRNNRSQCIFIGHSFGRLILENAICKALLSAIFRMETLRPGPPAVGAAGADDHGLLPVPDAGGAEGPRRWMPRQRTAARVDRQGGAVGVGAVRHWLCNHQSSLRLESERRSTNPESG